MAGMHGVGGSVDVDADVGTLTRGRDADDERIGDAAAVSYTHLRAHET